MKALLLEAPKLFYKVEVEPPGKPDLGEALVRVHRIGICGTDISGYLGKMPFFQLSPYSGHELGVEVLAVGDGVTNVRPGDHCSVEPYINNPDSYSSRKGKPNCCEIYRCWVFIAMEGCETEFLLPARKLHVSTKLAFDQLALVETLAIGCHAVNRGGNRSR